MGKSNRPSWASQPFKQATLGAPDRAPATWAGVKKLPEHAHSDLILNFRVPEGNDLGLQPGAYVAFLSFNEQWDKYTGMIKRDERNRENPKPAGGESECSKPTPDDIPF